VLLNAILNAAPQTSGARGGAGRLLEIGLCPSEAILPLLPPEVLCGGSSAAGAAGAGAVRSVIGHMELAEYRGVDFRRLPLFGASPDAVVLADDGAVDAVEVKNVSPFGQCGVAGGADSYVQDRAPAQTVPAMYMPQLQLEIFCVGPLCRGCYFVSLSAFSGASVFYVPRSDRYIALLLRMLMRMADMYCPTEPPPAPNRGASSEEESEEENQEENAVERAQGGAGAASSAAPVDPRPRPKRPGGKHKGRKGGSKRSRSAHVRNSAAGGKAEAARAKPRPQPGLDFNMSDPEYHAFVELTRALSNRAVAVSRVPQEAVQRSPHNRHYFWDDDDAALGSAADTMADHGDEVGATRGGAAGETRQQHEAREEDEEPFPPLPPLPPLLPLPTTVPSGAPTIEPYLSLPSVSPTLHFGPGLDPALVQQLLAFDFGVPDAADL
jgi:hypothetical protein